MIIVPSFPLRDGQIVRPSPFEVADERPRADLHDLLAGGTAHGGIRRDQAHKVCRPVLGRKPLEQRVCVRRVPHLERAVPLVRATAVEDEHTARAADGDEARERVAELSHVLEAPGV